MKISKLYSNNDNFKTIVFDNGINFILSDTNGVKFPGYGTILFKNYHDEKDFNKQPLSKMTKDLYNQINSLTK